MHKNLRRIIAIAALAVIALSCREIPEETAPSQTDSAASAKPSNLPLREIMRGLETDLAAVAHGIWIGDHEVVRTAATRIAEHPRVIPEQVAVLQAALGDEFPAFVQQDKAVHYGALDLVGAVDASRTTSELFGIFASVQQGCMSCHSGFQARVAEALTGAGEGS
jgi:cytochrome c556